jgi:hypothetical protein
LRSACAAGSFMLSARQSSFMSFAAKPAAQVSDDFHLLSRNDFVLTRTSPDDWVTPVHLQAPPSISSPGDSMLPSAGAASPGSSSAGTGEVSGDGSSSSTDAASFCSSDEDNEGVIALRAGSRDSSCCQPAHPSYQHLLSSSLPAGMLEAPRELVASLVRQPARPVCWHDLDHPRSAATGWALQQWYQPGPVHQTLLHGPLSCARHYTAPAAAQDSEQQDMSSGARRVLGEAEQFREEHDITIRALAGGPEVPDPVLSFKSAGFPQPLVRVVGGWCWALG